jgi:hypothetical protein
MTALSQVELDATMGGRADYFEWDEFFGTLGWVLGVSCGATGGNPAICGAAMVVGGANLFFF